MLVLGFAFAASWTVVTAMAVHLPRLLEAAVVCRRGVRVKESLISNNSVQFFCSKSTLPPSFK
jgi:hypothetical protein